MQAEDKFSAAYQHSSNKLFNAAIKTTMIFCITNDIQSNPLKWIALGTNYEYSLRQSIQLSMFYTLHYV